MNKKWVRRSGLGTPDCDEIEAKIDHRAAPHSTVEAGVHCTLEAGAQVPYIPLALHDTLDAAIQDQITQCRMGHWSGRVLAYGDGLYTEVEVRGPGSHAGTVLTTTTGAGFIRRYPPDDVRLENA